MMVTDATGRGAITVMAAVPFTVPIDAVIVTLPGVTPVTMPHTAPGWSWPSGTTVATERTLLLQVSGHTTTRPSASRSVAVKMMVSPAVTVTDVGVSRIDAG